VKRGIAKQKNIINPLQPPSMSKPKDFNNGIRRSENVSVISRNQRTQGDSFVISFLAMTSCMFFNEKKKFCLCESACPPFIWREGRCNLRTLFNSMTSIIIPLLFVSSVYASTLSDQLKHPKQQQLQREFRLNHDLSLFQKSWPLIQINDSQTNNVQLIAFPTLHLWQNKPIQSFALQAVGQWDELSLMVEPVIVNDPYGVDLLGADYVRAGLSGRIINGFIRYENDLISFQLGRAPVWWGQSLDNSIIDSDITPSYDHIDLRLKIWRFQLEILSGQLGSEFFQEERIKRNIAGHRLSWISKNEKLFAGFGEKIIYTGINRGFEWHYLNPFVPYFFTALEGDEETSAEGDNDNSIIFATFRYVHKPNLSFFSELIIDDFQVDDNNLQNGLGYRIGVDGAFNISSRQFTWVMEWTSINSWTYIHHGQFTSWQNRGHALGFPYGPDLNSLHIQADLLVRKSLSINIEADWLEKGSNTLNTEWGNADNKDAPFPKPPITHYTFFTTSLSWYWKYGILEAGWSNYDFPNKIAFTDPHTKVEGSLFLKVQFFYTLDFNL